MNKSERYSVRYPVVVEYAGKIGGVPISPLTSLGHSKDMSQSGIGIKLVNFPKHKGVGVPVHVSILPDGFDTRDDQKVDFEAIIVWRKSGDFGLRIKRITSYSMMLYERLMAEDKTAPILVPPPFRTESIADSTKTPYTDEENRKPRKHRIDSASGVTASHMTEMDMTTFFAGFSKKRS